MAEQVHVTGTYHLEYQHFNAVKEGRKKYEGRPITSRLIRETKKGDIIEFYAGPDNKNPATMNDHVYVEVIEKFKYFPNIDLMLLAIGYKNLLPDCNSFEDAVLLYKTLHLASTKTNDDGPMAVIQIELYNPKPVILMR